MIIEYIAAGVAGIFAGAIWAGWGITAQFEENDKLKQELNHLKKVGNLHIGQVVYACKYNSFYMGEITGIVCKNTTTRIEINNEENFDIGMIYTSKDEALQQIKI